MFLLKQFIKGLVLPPGIWLILIAAVLVFWKRKWSRKLLLATFIVVVLLHSGIVARGLRYTLESRFPLLIDCRAAAPYDAIVVLMGSAEMKGGLIPYPTLNLESFRRLDEALRLYRCDPKPVIVSGDIGRFPAPQGENKVLCDYLVRWGIPAGQIIQENRSRDTFEGAVEVKKILDGKGWHRYLLVTSAVHMPRSMLAFRAVAPEPIAAPGDFRVGPVSLDPLYFFPREAAAESSYAVLHEYVGLINYSWRAWRR
jgi:uncharacterized SAM-binding protein YcdF (DUF218 family)